MSNYQYCSFQNALPTSICEVITHNYFANPERKFKHEQYLSEYLNGFLIFFQQVKVLDYLSPVQAPQGVVVVAMVVEAVEHQWYLLLELLMDL